MTDVLSTTAAALAALTGLLPAVPLHLGALHPVERLLVLLVAFGPFVVLAVVVYVVRRRDIAEEERATGDRAAGRDRETR